MRMQYETMQYETMHFQLTTISTDRISKIGLTMNRIFSNSDVELINQHQFTAEEFDKIIRKIRKRYSSELKVSMCTLLVSSSMAFNI